MNTTEQIADRQFKSLHEGTVTIDEKQGIVECFVAAIGNKDSVGDIIEKGAFVGSLRRRKPRVVWGHDWNQPIGKVLEVYEVGPSDPRLPTKMRMAGVGGLFAKVQFNLKSEKGKEAFANIEFFGEEQEWSIGYKTLKSQPDNAQKATRLQEVELYEMSPVLHGANQLTSTISIKSADQPGDGDIVKGLAMVKTFGDMNPEFVSELEAEEKSLEEKGGKPSSDFRGEIAGGRGPRRGNLEDLLKYWRPIMKKPGGFRRCLVILADHPELGPDHRRICAWLHHETTGKWPNEGNHHGKSEEGVEFNPAFGEDAELVKALSEHLDEKILLTGIDGSLVSWKTAESDDEFEVRFSAIEGDFLFGTKKAKVKKHSCREGGPCECGGECQVEEKVGRTINRNNMSKLQQILALLQEVVSAGAAPDVELKSHRIGVKGGSEGIKSALEVVTAHHSPLLGSMVDMGDVIAIQLKSEEHLAAVQKVAKHFGAEVEELS